LEPVVFKGKLDSEALSKLDELTKIISQKHCEIGMLQNDPQEKGVFLNYLSLTHLSLRPLANFSATSKVLLS